jgi:hypothetical protein
VDVILGELPTLLFISICAIIVLRWAEIHHFAMKGPDDSPIRKAIIPVNVVLYVFFIIIVILYFTLPSKKTVSCLSSLRELQEVSPASIVAYIYKAILAIISLMLGIAVLYYGFAITRNLRKSKAIGQRQTQDRIKKMLSVSVACTLTLVASVANLIASAVVRDRTAVDIIIVTLIIEIAAAALIISLFNPSSEFTRSAQDVMQGKATLSTAGRSRGGSSLRRTITGAGSVETDSSVKLRMRRSDSSVRDGASVNTANDEDSSNSEKKPTRQSSSSSSEESKGAAVVDAPPPEEKEETKKSSKKTGSKGHSKPKADTAEKSEKKEEKVSEKESGSEMKEVSLSESEKKDESTSKKSESSSSSGSS